MTAEEAIRIIEVAKAECEWNAPLEYQEAFDVAIEALKAQPKHDQNTMSKQQDLETLGIKTGETCEDAISRQAAIDVILSDKIDDASLEIMTALGDGRLALTLNDACDRHIRAIEHLPSAQQEIIHCGDCIHWINKHLCEIWSRYGTIETKPDFYCGFGERINNE